ncbi:protein Ycf2-like [Cyprinodon tularosa]|uniref:protein Ycf2-like n=1 Tax=Cyprinodon tularosa TaxID=77115 RepID=UPI0018E1E833|nr:protein Ycf2-like [Cyprinodon tularosa]XP_038153373.1 protein Ycf2-like [Cyprinodon tularosa]
MVITEPLPVYNEEIEVQEIVVDNEEIEVQEIVVDNEEIEVEEIVVDYEEVEVEGVVVEEYGQAEMWSFEGEDVAFDDVRSFSGESLEVSSDSYGYDTTSSEEEDDEDDDHLPPHLRFTQRIPPDFRLPWNPEEPKESLECTEDRVSGKRRREEDEEDDEDDEDDDYLPPHLQFNQMIPPDFRLPWNHEEPEESLECPEDRVSGKRRREEDDEDDDHLPPHLRFTQRIPPDFRLPWNHEEPEESLECPEDRVSRRRRREEDNEEELPWKRLCRERDF